MHGCTHACVCACVYVCMHACMYKCMYVCGRVCMYVCMYTCVRASWCARVVRAYVYVLVLRNNIHFTINRQSSKHAFTNDFRRVAAPHVRLYKCSLQHWFLHCQIPKLHHEHLYTLASILIEAALFHEPSNHSSMLQFSSRCHPMHGRTNVLWTTEPWICHSWSVISSFYKHKTDMRVSRRELLVVIIAFPAHWAGAAQLVCQIFVFTTTNA